MTDEVRERRHLDLQQTFEGIRGRLAAASSAEEPQLIQEARQINQAMRQLMSEGQGHAPVAAKVRIDSLISTMRRSCDGPRLPKA
jgi:hypothetical protein